MPYKPTGNPPGRPKKEPEKPPKPETHPGDEVTGPPPPPGREGSEHTGRGELCAECYPAGWPDGATGLGCKHGGWTRRPGA